APARKQDPGEKFPWKQLAQSGVGLWVEPVRPGDKVLALGDSGEMVTLLQKDFAEYGYGIEQNGRFDSPTTEVVTAFQRHSRQARADGMVAASTRDVSSKLLQACKKGAAPQASVSALDAALRRPHP